MTSPMKFNRFFKNALFIPMLAFAVGRVLAGNGVPTLYTWFLSVTLSLLFVIFLEIDLPRFYAFLIVKRGKIILITWAALVIAATLIFLGLEPVSEISSYNEIFRIPTVGLVLGWASGAGLTSRTLLTLQAGSTEGFRIRFVLFLSVLLILVPLPPEPLFVTSLYFLGVVFGFLFNYVITSERVQSRRAQRLLNILARIQGNDQPKGFGIDEKTAINYYARGEFGKLQKLVEEVQEKERLSTTLAIIWSSSLCIQADYKSAIGVLEAELARPDRTKGLVSNLHTLMAFCFAEIGDYKNMWRSLHDALLQNRNSMVANIACGLRLAEEIPLWKETGRETGDQPLQYIQKALQIRSRENSLPLVEDVVGSSIPVTWSMLVDAYAYCLLKGGEMRLSRTLLTECIVTDPSLASAYLHIGEWHLKAAGEDLLSTERRSELFRLARISFHIAKYIEGRRNGLVKRRADKYLQELDQVIQGRSPDPEAERLPDPEAEKLPAPEAERLPDPEAERLLDDVRDKLLGTGMEGAALIWETSFASDHTSEQMPAFRSFRLLLSPFLLALLGVVSASINAGIALAAFYSAVLVSCVNFYRDGLESGRFLVNPRYLFLGILVSIGLLVTAVVATVEVLMKSM